MGEQAHQEANQIHRYMVSKPIGFKGTRISYTNLKMFACNLTIVRCNSVTLDIVQVKIKLLWSIAIVITHGTGQELPYERGD